MIASIEAVPFTTMGYLRVPDAYVLPNKAAEITFTNYLRREYNVSHGPNAPYEYVPMGMLNIGLFNRFEIGAWGGDKLGFFNAKAKIVDETTIIPQVTVGVDDILSPIGIDAQKIKPGQKFYDNPDRFFYEKNSPYVVFSKASVVKGWGDINILETVLSLGFGRNKFRGQVALAHTFEGIFGSISVKPTKDVTLIAENDGFNLNLGAQYTYKNFAFKIAYVGLEEQENNRIGIAFTYLFDKFADSRQRPTLYMDDKSSSSKASESLISPQKGRDVNANKDLLDELKKLREQREQAQKVLDNLKDQLKDMEDQPKN
jgi:hypothetical protein